MFFKEKKEREREREKAQSIPIHKSWEVTAEAK